MTLPEMLQEIDRLAFDHPNRVDIHNLAAALHNRAAEAENRLEWVKKGTLTQSDETETDYELAEGRSAWITVGPLSVWVRDLDSSMEIEVYKHYNEAESNPLDTMGVEYPAHRATKKGEKEKCLNKLI
jgi:hypothetical protein